MAAPIIIKFLEKSSLTAPENRDWWCRQLPGNTTNWGRCHFEFDPACSRYDWLVVYDDLPVVPPENKHGYIETLACPQENALFITAEPSSIKTYGSAFLNQFGVVLTSHEPRVLKHSGVIRSQPALRWHYGVSMDHPGEGLVSYDEMRASAPMAKSRLLSTVCSSKRMRWTMHARRYDFSTQLKHEIPGADLFGYGTRPIDDKREALDPYKYHVAIENHICDHHWTEKLADAFLGYTLPLYCGAPNAADYFPEQSFIPIDIRRPEQAYERIRQAISENAYEKRLDWICEARERVLDQYNLFAVISHQIDRLESQPRGQTIGGRISSRHLARRASPWIATRYLTERTLNRAIYLISRMSR